MFRGKLMGLGITQIVTGIIAVIIGIIEISVVVRGPFRISDFSVHIGTPWWTGLLFIIAGSLAVAVEKDPTLPMIRGCLAMNILSAISCLPGVIIYCINLAYPYCFSLYYCYYHEGTIPCLVILLLLTLLNAAISIAISSFNCKSLNCCCATPNPTVVLVNTAIAQPFPQQNFHVNPPPYNIHAMGNIQVG
ncbi:membrane-spanning 4-domains subfamily A member 8-like [Mustelus asterias]